MGDEHKQLELPLQQPKTWEEWQHNKNGKICRILGTCNIHNTLPNLIPTVTYEDEAGTEVSKPVREFVQKFTRVY